MRGPEKINARGFCCLKVDQFNLRTSTVLLPTNLRALLFQRIRKCRMFPVDKKLSVSKDRLKQLWISIKSLSRFRSVIRLLEIIPLSIEVVTRYQLHVPATDTELVVQLVPNT